MQIIYTKAGFSIYNYVDNLLTSPIDTISETVIFFQDKGYFNFSHLYKEFYDKSISTNLLHYETILFYLFISISLFYLNKFFFKIKHFNKKFFNIIFPINAIKSKSFTIDVSWFIFNILKINSLFINLLASVFLLNKVPIVARSKFL